MTLVSKLRETPQESEESVGINYTCPLRGPQARVAHAVFVFTQLRVVARSDVPRAATRSCGPDGAASFSMIRVRFPATRAGATPVRPAATGTATRAERFRRPFRSRRRAAAAALAAAASTSPVMEVLWMAAAMPAALDGSRRRECGSRRERGDKEYFRGRGDGPGLAERNGALDARTPVRARAGATRRAPVCAVCADRSVWRARGRARAVGGVLA